MARYRIEKNGIREVATSGMLNAQRNLWIELHQYRLAFWDAEQAKTDYKKWRARIPNYGCGCSSKWAKLEEQYPPNFTSADAYFRWGVGMHNSVNLELYKPLIDYDAAWEMHQAIHETASLNSSLL